MSKSSSPRGAAVGMIGNVLDHTGTLSEPAELAAKGKAPDPRDAAQARHIAYGVLRWLGALEWLAAQLLKKPLKHKDRDIHRLILVGLFELWKSEGAEHAAVHETAEGARQLGKPWATGLINAVLRRFQREKSAWLEKLSTRTERFSHPEWLLKRLREDWPEHWQAMAEANNRQAGLWIRVNAAKTSLETVEQALDEAGLETRRHQHAPLALEVIPPAPVEQLPGFSDGLWSVQDPAAQMAAAWLDAQPGERILDACAAPGGKTCHLLETAPETRVLALDRSAKRLERVKQSAKRLGFDGEKRLEIQQGDAADPSAWWDGQVFDRILLDAPCTALGVIRRHPEIKWLRSPEQVNEAVALQATLLNRLWPTLKPGGILVYATCSVLGDENSRQIKRFLEDHEDAQALDPEVAYGHAGEAGVQILPGESDMDGFYYARIKKAL